MSRSKQQNHWGKQRRMRAKAKVTIRRRDRKRLGRPTEESGTIERVDGRSHLCNVK